MSRAASTEINMSNLAGFDVKEDTEETEYTNVDIVVDDLNLKQHRNNLIEFHQALQQLENSLKTRTAIVYGGRSLYTAGVAMSTASGGIFATPLILYLTDALVKLENTLHTNNIGLREELDTLRVALESFKIDGKYFDPDQHKTFVGVIAEIVKLRQKIEEVLGEKLTSSEANAIRKNAKIRM
jgi:hypothetical protein